MTALTDADQDAGLREAVAEKARSLCAQNCYWATNAGGHCSECSADEDGYWLRSAAASIIATLRSRLTAAEAERDEALREHTDMMWQRRRADERADAAQVSVLSLTEENARLRAIISESATAIGNGARIGPVCSLDFMAWLPREISGVTYDLRKRVGVLERFLDFLLMWRDRGPPHGDPEIAWSVVSHHPVVRRHAEARSATIVPPSSPGDPDV